MNTAPLGASQFSHGHENKTQEPLTAVGIVTLLLGIDTTPTWAQRLHAGRENEVASRTMRLRWLSVIAWRLNGRKVPAKRSRSFVIQTVRRMN